MDLNASDLHHRREPVQPSPVIHIQMSEENPVNPSDSGSSQPPDPLGRIRPPCRSCIHQFPPTFDLDQSGISLTDIPLDQASVRKRVEKESCENQ
jgi:hypothetical protein